MPQVSDVTLYEVVSGRTEPFETVEVRARVEGVLLEVAHADGFPVEEGALMFRIDPEPFIAARDAAQAEVTSAEAQAELADITATKLEKAYEDRAVSELQALEARAQHNVAVQKVEVARKNLAIRELDVEYTSIHAHIAGRPVKSDFYVGSLVGGLGSAALTTIVDDSKVRAWFTVPDRIFLAYAEKRGAVAGTVDPAELLPAVELAREIDEGFPIQGRVDYADPQVDVETGTLRVRAVFDNADGRLKGGLFVRIRLRTGEQKNAVIVPEVALGRDQQGQYVYVVGNGDEVERREVVLGDRVEGGIIVTDGVAPDDRVIVAGQLSARPGAKVAPREQERSDG
jgi:RND family efflux transporter MFP subunit